MVDITTCSIFGKKPLIEEQIELAYAYQHLAHGAMSADPRIMESYWIENVIEHLGKERRRNTAIRNFKKALELMDRIM
jgi:hypothetical protein